MRVVIAIPTILARPGLAERTADVWHQRTPGHDLTTIITTEGESWAAGLNHVAAAIADDPPDVLACGSDDMIPADEQWLHHAATWLEQGMYPAPRVDDPRFVNYGGHRHPVPDGTPAGMSTFPLIRGDWLDYVFPLPPDLHYYSDNLIALKLHRAGIQCVAAPACRILHLHAPEGRGAGYGTENTRLHIDTVRYTRELDALGIDRDALTDGLRGPLWEPHYLEAGRAIGG